jgi:tRNA A-37 threonylcarbamoyl transferase component Bud32
MAAARVGFLENQVLLDRYELRRRVGMGDRGAVYAAYDRKERRDIAVKVLRPGLLENERSRQEFLKEGRIATYLSRHNIAQVFSVEQEAPFFFVVMELLGGRTLREEIDRRNRSKEQFSIREVQTVAAALCDALHYAHQYTVHGDVKPENVFLEGDENIKLTDFAMACLTADQGARRASADPTVLYRAPEQLSEGAIVDHHADQYSLAVILCEMLAGEVPKAPAPFLRAQRTDIPESFAIALNRALQSKPEDRYPDMSAFAQALVAGPARGRSHLARSAAVLLVIGVAAGLSYGAWRWNEARKEEALRVAALQAQQEATEAAEKATAAAERAATAAQVKLEADRAVTARAAAEAEQVAAQQAQVAAEQAKAEAEQTAAAARQEAARMATARAQADAERTAAAQARAEADRAATRAMAEQVRVATARAQAEAERTAAARARAEADRAATARAEADAQRTAVARAQDESQQHAARPTPAAPPPRQERQVAAAKVPEAALAPRVAKGSIASLNATVTSLRFFEKERGEDVPPEERKYSNRFKRSRTRGVYWELALSHPPQGKRRQLTIHSVCKRADGSVFGSGNLDTYVESNWGKSTHVYGWGFRESGNWKPGSYNVDIFVGGDLVASDTFWIE